ncbi:hypothetical protein EYF80_017424 [Liparis tanakae]|uniref:Uncharacterized protein n=1 Tax=Liparis tanakae TaxID=230148 RepID=A0A4Z2I4K9_9TELE|nr:hypothetical protein EYF80_017424 [Liparis tanakae]
MWTETKRRSRCFGTLSTHRGVTVRWRWSCHEARRLLTEVIRVGAGTGGRGEVVEVGREVRGRRRGAGGHAAEDEVEGRGLRAAVELRLDLLRVGVRRQLLAAALRHEEQAVVLRVRHFELVGAHAAHLLHGGVRAHLERLGRAAAVQLLQRHPQRGRASTWKSSMDGAERCVVRRRCHWRSVSRVSELSTLAACSSWKLRIRDMAPYALVR